MQPLAARGLDILAQHAYHGRCNPRYVYVPDGQLLGLAVFFGHSLHTLWRDKRTMPTRSIVYVDGFNFYKGALERYMGRHATDSRYQSPIWKGCYKWLNLQAYFALLRPKDDIQRIRYFTARIHGKKVVRQRAYLRALETLPNVRVYLGRFKARTVRIPWSQDTIQVPEGKAD